MSTYVTPTTAVTYPTGNTITGPAPDGVYVASPGNGTSGLVTINGATPVNVVATKVTANTQVIFTINTLGGTQGATPTVATKTAATGFSVKGTASDTSIYNWMILEPSPV